MIFKELGGIENHIKPLGNTDCWIEGIKSTKVAAVLQRSSGTLSIDNHSTLNIKSEINTGTPGREDK